MARLLVESKPQGIKFWCLTHSGYSKGLPVELTFGDSDVDLQVIYEMLNLPNLCKLIFDEIVGLACSHETWILIKQRIYTVFAEYSSKKSLKLYTSKTDNVIIEIKKYDGTVARIKKIHHQISYLQVDVDYFIKLLKNILGEDWELKTYGLRTKQTLTDTQINTVIKYITTIYDFNTKFNPLPKIKFTDGLIDEPEPIIFNDQPVNISDKLLSLQAEIDALKLKLNNNNCA